MFDDVSLENKPLLRIRTNLATNSLFVVKYVNVYGGLILNIAGIQIILMRLLQLLNEMRFLRSRHISKNGFSSLCLEVMLAYRINTITGISR